MCQLCVFIDIESNRRQADTLLTYLEWPSEDAARSALGRSALAANTAVSSTTSSVCGTMLGVMLGSLAILHAANDMLRHDHDDDDVLTQFATHYVDNDVVDDDTTSATTTMTETYSDESDLSALDAPVVLPWLLLPLWTPGTLMLC